MVKMLWLSISLIFAMGGCYVTNVTKIGKDKSYDTHAYKDTTHKVILRTFSYFLKIVTHIGQVLLSGRVIIHFFGFFGFNFFWENLRYINQGSCQKKDV